MRTLLIALLTFTVLTLCSTLLLPTNALASSASKAETKDEKAVASEIIRKAEEIIPLLQKAIDTNDAALANSLLNFDSLTSSFLQNAMPLINAAVSSGKIKLEQPLPIILSGLNGKGSAKRTAEMFLGAEVGKFVLYGIQSGYFAGKPISPEELSRLDGGLLLPFSKAGLGRKKFGSGMVTYEDNKLSIVHTSLYDYTSKKEIELDILMEKRLKTWIITSIENNDEILTSLLGKYEAKQE